MRELEQRLVFKFAFYWKFALLLCLAIMNHVQ